MFHALKLHRPQHQIIWLIEHLDYNISELESLSDCISDEQIKVKIQENLNKLLLAYRTYTKRLGNI